MRMISVLKFGLNKLQDRVKTILSAVVIEIWVVKLLKLLQGVKTKQ